MKLEVGWDERDVVLGCQQSWQQQCESSRASQCVVCVLAVCDFGDSPATRLAAAAAAL
jgi:hypothetical protein